MWLAIHDGVFSLGVSLRKKMTEAGRQTAEVVVILMACLFSFVAREHEIQPSGTCYHPNCHCRWKISLILRNLNKQVHVPNFWGVAGSEDFACATLPTTPLDFQSKIKNFCHPTLQKLRFKITVTTPLKNGLNQNYGASINSNGLLTL